MDFIVGSLLEAVDRSVTAADHLSSVDDAAVAALRELASRIDTESDLRQAMLRWASDKDLNVRQPKDDNVSIPTFLKYCESLGLTPAGRKSIGKKEGNSDSPPSGISGRRQKASHLRSA